MKFISTGVLALGLLVGATSGLAAPKNPAAPKTPASTAPNLTISGDLQKPRTWTVEQLKKLTPVQTITTTLKGQPYVAHGIALRSLIEAAAPRLDTKVKHSEARFIVLARGSDGYLAAFSWPELMADVGNKGAFVIWEANGKPLSAKEGPLRLIVPSDKKPMRWVFNLVGLEIYDAKKLSTATPNVLATSAST